MAIVANRLPNRHVLLFHHAKNYHKHMKKQAHHTSDKDQESTPTPLNAPVSTADKSLAYEQIEKDLNDKIMAAVLNIKDCYPELLGYLDEMPITLPSKNNDGVTLNHLQSYHESLIALMAEYDANHTKAGE